MRRGHAPARAGPHPVRGGARRAEHHPHQPGHAALHTAARCKRPLSVGCTFPVCLSLFTDALPLHAASELETNLRKHKVCRCGRSPHVQVGVFACTFAVPFKSNTVCVCVFISSEVRSGRTCRRCSVGWCGCVSTTAAPRSSCAAPPPSPTRRST